MKKTIKISIMLVAVMAVSGCGKVERIGASFTGGGVETCHDGVKYIQFTSGASVKYNKDGTITTC